MKKQGRGREAVLISYRRTFPTPCSSCHTHSASQIAKSFFFNADFSAARLHFSMLVGGRPRVMSEKLEKEVTRTVSLDSAFVAVTCAVLLYAVSWVMGCATAPPHDSGGRKKLTSTREAIKLSPEDAGDKLVPTVSGRKLTVERMAQRAATSLQYSNEEYGVAFDAPKGYLLKEGELPEMDRGLGYLGPIPMHFAEPGGIRLATVQPPHGLHLGTNFLNEYFTVRAHSGSFETVSSEFIISAESRGAPVARTVD